MAKDETSRGAELLALGWTAEEVRKYEELWEYRQRWGAINLEPEDRQVLRKAEALLPKRVAGKGSAKKAIQDKAYYQWLSFYREAMLAAATGLGLGAGEEAAWAIVIEEEQRALDYYQPVLGLPDTLKAKLLMPPARAVDQRSWRPHPGIRLHRTPGSLQGQPNHQLETPAR